MALPRCNNRLIENGSHGDTPYNTRYTFDSSGNKISQQDAQEHLTRWEYDANNRVTARILPAGESESFTYNAIGTLLSKTDFN